MVISVSRFVRALWGKAWWSVGAITFLGALALAVGSQWGLSPTTVTSLQISLAVAGLGLLIKNAMDDAIHAIYKTQVPILKKESRDTPYHRLARKAFDEFQLALAELSQAEEHPQFTTEKDYLAYLTEYIQDLPADAEIGAVCGPKTWSSAEVKKYFAVNCDAARRGIRITRIFIQNCSKEQRRVMDNHVRAGATTLVISPKHLAPFGPDSQLDFGFIVLPNEVLLHWGPPGRFQGRRDL